MTSLRALAAAGALCALAACSGGAPSEGDGTQSQFAGLDEALAETLSGAIGGTQAAMARRTAGATPATPPRLVILDETDAPEAPRLVIRDTPTPAPGPLLAAELPARGTSARLGPSGRNGEVVTWRSLDAVSLSLRTPGVLVATRGLGADLHVADASATASALTRGTPGRVERRHRRLDGNFVLRDARFVCDLSLAGRERIEVAGLPRETLRFEERCAGGDEDGFVNVYWRDATRPVVWQSVEWLGPELGALHLQRLGD